MKPKLSNTLPYCFAIAHALLVIAIFVLIKISHDPQVWLFFIIVFAADFPASIGIKYLSDIPTASGNMGDWLTFGIFLLLGSALVVPAWMGYQRWYRGGAADHTATRLSS